MKLWIGFFSTFGIIYLVSSSEIINSLPPVFGLFITGLIMIFGIFLTLKK
jgi:hypothetical protein